MVTNKKATGIGRWNDVAWTLLQRQNGLTTTSF